MKTFDVAYEWFINEETQLEMHRWMDKNIKHYYRRHYKCCDIYCFKDELDAVAFKLRWS
ncbi:hypothetical protein LCGC14_2515510 [marine sediment metagenome]|uniref:Uncharacterized protein n=1 Tax=marine sediment metagenome TaxID=412755 RepID=A0A0F9AXU7_9ZZZZ